VLRKNVVAHFGKEPADRNARIGTGAQKNRPFGGCRSDFDFDLVKSRLGGDDLEGQKFRLEREGTSTPSTRTAYRRRFVDTFTQTKDLDESLVESNRKRFVKKRMR